MNQTQLTVSKQDAYELNRLYQFYQYFTDKGDGKQAGKIKDLIRKVINREKIVAFCGHFSAGKSTMVNHLIGEQVLPSSPIPTSANLVKIRVKKNWGIKVYLHDGTIQTFPSHVSFDKLKRYFKDGELIRSVDIEIPSPVLPEGAVVMDTPGIDSTDDAHRLATESALHLADTIFYVMDYNHVQAEENFLFTKEMTDYGKDVYLVVNMIDKHREQELSFEMFKQMTKDAFHAWSIEPKGIFYTSLKDFSHPHNELEELKEEIRTIFAEEVSLETGSSLKLIIDEHLKDLLLEMEEEREKHEEILHPLNEEEKEEIRKEYNRLNEEINIRKEAVANFQDKYDEELHNLLDNAYLMPADTRSLAKAFLESARDDFKVGFLFTKKKTEEARKARLEAFRQSLQENVDREIVRHLKELFLRLLNEAGIHHSKTEADIQALSLPVTGDMLKDAVKEGALVTGESVLNYTSDVAELIKKYTMNAGREIFLEIKKLADENAGRDLADLNNKLAEVSKYMTAMEALEHYDKKYENTKNMLLAMYDADGATPEEDQWVEIERLLSGSDEVVEEIGEPFLEEEPDVKKEKRKRAAEKKEQTAAEDLGKEQQALTAKLKKTAELLSGIPTMEKVSGQLKKRAARLENRQFTVSLFGAFSAGKSSFANALMGEKLLPVSPNPTTAAINRILPAGRGHPSGTGVVTFKSEEQMLADINEALEKFGYEAKTLDEGYQYVEKLHKNKEENQVLKTHLSFLNAFHKGYPSFADKLGKKLTVNKDKFQRFVAEEDKSCFVEGIDFYTDSPVTNKGITFVDTPGADSINARHTDVAFEYIKNADAIIFVTYYNHAFSKADREFLIQLGRVKDQFALDKMFFIVNAVDLAQSEEDLEEVLAYVEGELLKFGIRNVKLYPVSSLNALKEKLTGEKLGSGFPDFEHDFYRFITHDLRKLALNTAEQEWKQAQERLALLVETAETDLAEREAKLQTLTAEEEKIKHILDDQASVMMKEQLKQEAKELVYYIKQRHQYRFGDFFRETFNPATIKGSGQEAKRGLEAALKELLTAVGFDLAQELRATSLRLENYANKKLREQYETVAGQLKNINRNLAFSLFEDKKIETPRFENEIRHIPAGRFAKTLGLFKNPKLFFEGNGKKQMEEKLFEDLSSYVDAYLQDGETRLIEKYTGFIDHCFDDIIARFSEESAEQYNGWRSILDEKMDIDRLKNILKELEQMTGRKNTR